MAGPPSLSILLRRFSNLEEAWRHVHSHAIRSQSSEIRSEARAFERSATTTLRSIQSRLGQGCFKFEPARGITIRRKGKTPRPVVVAPIESRIVQRALLNVLQGIPAIKAELQAGYNYGGVSGTSFGVPAAIAKALLAVRSSGYYIRCTAPGSLDTHLCYAAWRAHTPRAPQDTQASRDARSGCTAPRIGHGDANGLEVKDSAVDRLLLERTISATPFVSGSSTKPKLGWIPQYRICLRKWSAGTVP